MALPGYPPSTSYTQPAGPVDVVGPQFCASYPVELTVTKKAISMSQGDFTVTDINGNVVFRVKGAIFSVRSRRVLVDANGNPLLSMQQKILSTHKRWRVFRGESSDPKDHLFSVKKSSFFQFKTKLDVFLATNPSESACDFKIKGSYFDRSCIIYLGNSDTIVAQMRKHYTVGSVLLGKDTFGVTVYPHVDYAFIVALIVVLDEINKEQRGGNATTNLNM